MPIDPLAFMALAPACAPTVAAGTLRAIAQVESGLEPLAIGINGPGARALRPASRAEAVSRARALLKAGRNLDLGIAQINARNLAALGLTVEAAFDPCRNLRAAGALLTANYRQAAASGATGQAGLRVALSRYNTGDARRGFANGYVARVIAAAARFEPARSEQALPHAPPTPPPVAAWDVFGDLSAPGGATRVLINAQEPRP